MNVLRPNPDWMNVSWGVPFQWANEIFTFTGGAGSASFTWATANMAMYIPLYVRCPIQVRGFYTINGATASGNTDIGIYTEGGTKIISTGSTAQAGTSVPQNFVLTTSQFTGLSRGRYYLGVAHSDTTGTFSGFNTANTELARMLGCRLQLTALPLPATATFATLGTAAPKLPIVGIN